MEISKELQNLNVDDLLVSYDFNNLPPSAQIGKNCTWAKIEKSYPPKKCTKYSTCSLFKCGRWNQLNRSGFLIVKYHNPEKLIFQHLPTKKLNENPYKNNRFQVFNRKRNGIFWILLQVLIWLKL